MKTILKKNILFKNDFMLIKFRKYNCHNLNILEKLHTFIKDTFA